MVKALKPISQSQREKNHYYLLGKASNKFWSLLSIVKCCWRFCYLSSLQIFQYYFFIMSENDFFFAIPYIFFFLALDWWSFAFYSFSVFIYVWYSLERNIVRFVEARRQWLSETGLGNKFSDILGCDSDVETKNS